MCHIYRYYKNLGVGKFCPNSKFPDKRSPELTRSDCTIQVSISQFTNEHTHWLIQQAGAIEARAAAATRYASLLGSRAHQIKIGRELVQTRHTLELHYRHLQLLLIRPLQRAQEVAVLHLVVLLLAQLPLQHHEYFEEGREADDPPLGVDGEELGQETLDVLARH